MGTLGIVEFPASGITDRAKFGRLKEEKHCIPDNGHYSNNTP